VEWLWVGDDLNGVVIGFTVVFNGPGDISVLQLATLSPTVGDGSSQFGHSLGVGPKGSHLLIVGDPAADCLHA
jgi:hypothetical protein